MTFNTSIHKPYFKLRRQDRWWGYFYLLLLIVAALVLLTVNLDKLSLNQLQEATDVKIAKEILQAPPYSWRWLFPTLAGKPELFKPPLFPDLLAFTYKVAGFSPLTTRLPSAILGAFSTAILYGIGRELFKTTTPTLLACCVYITFFPVISQGRLGTLDAPLLCFEMFTIWAFLRSRRDLRWTLITGFGFCLVGLTDNWAIFPLGLLLLGFFRWDTPRLLICSYFYFGLLLGILPLVAWWLAQWYYYEPPSLLNSGAEISQWLSLENFAFQVNSPWQWLRNQPFHHYLSVTLHYGSPWFIVAFYGLRLAWHYRIWGWAKFLLAASLVCSLCWLLALMNNSFNLFANTQINFHGSVLPFYSVLALAAGRQLYQLRNLPSYISYPLSWVSVFNGSAIAIVLLALYGELVLKIHFDWLLVAILALVVLTLMVTSLLLARRDIQFVYILIWGNYISLLLFFGFHYLV
jgi:4-amino-4-deoxy-L-arabinose transferase-like glycosyltransferase